MNHPELRMQQGGDPDADTLLVLLHGLGATSEVWNGFTALLRERRWPGRWLAPDLPGHGGSAPLPAYGFAPLAAALAPAIPRAKHLMMLGHSLGGAIALELASGRYGLAIAGVAAVGIKFQWTAEEVARAVALSKRPNPVYATRGEAAERHLKLAGLTGLIAPDAVPEAALRRDGRGWTLAFDPKAFDVGTPDMATLLGEAQARVLLATGERDTMCKPEVLLALRPEARVLPGLGHNAQVESPEAMLTLLEALAA